MIRLASIALTSVLGVAGTVAALPALAGPAVVVEVPVPGYFAGPYAYVRGPFGAPYAGYWHGDYYRHGWHWDHYHHGYRR